MTSKRSIPVLMVAFLLIGACADQVNDPTVSMGTRQFAFESGDFSEPVGPVKLAEPAIESFAYALVEPSGGRVYDDVNRHEIKVMPRTVSEPTWFLMRTLPGDYVVVDLTAWRRSKDGVWTQVTNFDSDGVKLRLSYAKTGVKQANRLRVAYLPNDTITGPLEPMFTQIDKTNKQAQAKLSHFSRYTMAMD
jgi:hypothetical protein